MAKRIHTQNSRSNFATTTTNKKSSQGTVVQSTVKRSTQTATRNLSNNGSRGCKSCGQ